MVYLDWAATALPDDDIIAEAARVAHEVPGNPSSRHAFGREAADLLHDCRGRVAACIGAKQTEIVFTASATESNTLAVTSQLRRTGGGHVIVSDREHPSLGRAASGLKAFGFDVTVLRGSPSQPVNALDIINSIREDTIFLGTTLVDSSAGTILDVRQVSDAVHALNATRKRKIFHHCDCVQGVGKLAVRIGDIGVDSASLSAHKIAAPRGAAVLYRSGPLEPLVRGGGQEFDIRPGTENLSAVYGLTLAMERYGDAPHLSTARALETAIHEIISTIDGASLLPQSRGVSVEAHVLGEAAHTPMREPMGFSPYITTFEAPPIPGEVLARVLSDSGVAVSRGSACAENLSRRGTKEDAHAVRVSIGYGTSAEDIDAFGTVLREAVQNLRGDLT